ncbi:hypothetical protein SO802_025791 [Lithocarpus litseifolius]|uniref:RNase H type-1 domain-containing protein n=1 Tax=Lithocarpus litseifolius TaxID=425828 RepID=A0AAW2BZK2_9ROSI
MPHSQVANEEDRIIWDASSNGEFNLSSAYTLANGEAPQSFNGKWIWKLKVLPRIQFFIWMCFHNSIATRESHSIHKEIIHKAAEYSFIAQNFSNRNPRIERSIRWERPNRGWHKLNTDGSSLGNLGLASGGGILRNEVGGWIRAFSRKIGITTSFVAELWARRDGLSMCVDMQIPALEVELDARVVADLMNNTTRLNSDYAAIVADCRQLLCQIPQVKVSYCYQEANRCADALTRIGRSKSLNVMFFNFPPPF